MDDKEYKKQWYQKNKERIKQRSKETTKRWYENGGKEWYREYSKKYESNPENRKRRNERRKKYRSNPEYRERENMLAKKRYNAEKQHESYKKGMLKPEIRKNRQESSKRWRSIPENKEKRNKWHKEYSSKPENRKRSRERVLKRKYNITLSDESEMYNNQDGRCAICNYKFKKYDGVSNCNDFVIDHCHKTGNVRGLLCGKCNKGIGLLLENKKTIENILKYLESNGIR